MKRTRHTAEQIVKKLREAEELRSAGRTFAEAAKELGVSEHTLHRWRAKFASLSEDETKRLKELEKENARLKKVVAEQVMDISTLKELLAKNW